MLDIPRTFALLMAVSLIGFVGCKDDSPLSAVESANSTNIQKLSNLYNQFQADNGLVGPSSEEEFRDYIANGVPDFLKERINLAPDDDIFVSERDGKPFKIRFEIPTDGRGCNAPAIFEAEGVGGKFMVGFLNMNTREVEQNEYQDLWDGKEDS